MKYHEKGIHSEPIEAFYVDAPPMEMNPELVWPALQRSGFRRTEAMTVQVKGLLPLGKALVRARAMAWLYAVESMSATELENFPKPICDADFLCFGLCTAGQAIDDRTRQLRSAGELIDSMILDSIALTGLSWVGDELGQRIFSWAEGKRLAASRAFSPGAGVGLWDLDKQRVLFDHLPREPLGVRLTQHFLMQPSKSISFVIGIGKHMKQATNLFSCEGCDRSDCDYRHTPNGEMVQAKASQIFQGVDETENTRVT